jgi:hypothetical protein
MKEAYVVSRATRPRNDSILMMLMAPGAKTANIVEFFGLKEMALTLWRGRDDCAIGDLVPTCTQ